MTPPSQIRVMIVDDHFMVRFGLKAILAASENLLCVGEAVNGEEAVRLCDELTPDVILMDLVMPGMRGEDAIQAIRRKHPDTQVIALTSFVDAERVQHAVRSGAVGYLLKNVSMQGLAEAIRAAHAGRATIAPEATQAVLYAALEAPPPHFELTGREGEILALVTEGLTNAEIAKRLVISLPTARFHISNILAKLGAANRTEAARLAHKYGLAP